MNGPICSGGLDHSLCRPDHSNRANIVLLACGATIMRCLHAPVMNILSR